jgi:hypothetical protein
MLAAATKNGSHVDLLPGGRREHLEAAGETSQLVEVLVNLVLDLVVRRAGLELVPLALVATGLCARLGAVGVLGRAVHALVGFLDREAQVSG